MTAAVPIICTSTALSTVLVAWLWFSRHVYPMKSDECLPCYCKDMQYTEESEEEGARRNVLPSVPWLSPSGSCTLEYTFQTDNQTHTMAGGSIERDAASGTYCIVGRKIAVSFEDRRSEDATMNNVECVFTATLPLRANATGWSLDSAHGDYVEVKGRNEGHAEPTDVFFTHLRRVAPTNTKCYTRPYH